MITKGKGYKNTLEIDAIIYEWPPINNALRKIVILLFKVPVASKTRSAIVYYNY